MDGGRIQCHHRHRDRHTPSPQEEWGRCNNNNIDTLSVHPFNTLLLIFSHILQLYFTNESTFEIITFSYPLLTSYPPPCSFPRCGLCWTWTTRRWKPWWNKSSTQPHPHPHPRCFHRHHPHRWTPPLWVCLRTRGRHINHKGHHPTQNLTAAMFGNNRLVHYLTNKHHAWLTD